MAANAWRIPAAASRRFDDHLDLGNAVNAAASS
jgi:hypothetical protein